MHPAPRNSLVCCCCGAGEGRQASASMTLGVLWVVTSMGRGSSQGKHSQNNADLFGHPFLLRSQLLGWGSQLEPPLSSFYVRKICEYCMCPTVGPIPDLTYFFRPLDVTGFGKP